MGTLDDKFEAPKYELETSYRIYNNKTGEHVQVCLDGDGLGLVEVSCRDKSGKIETHISFTREEIPLLIDALENFRLI